jgi:hypothetical protein
MSGRLRAQFNASACLIHQAGHQLEGKRSSLYRYTRVMTPAENAPAPIVISASPDARNVVDSAVMMQQIPAATNNSVKAK